MADPVTLIQATLAPIFLVSGAAIFLNFTQTRLFRVIDRLRANAEEAPPVEDHEARRQFESQQKRNLARAVILRNAILSGVLVIGFTVATTLLILLPAAFGAGTQSVWPIVTFAVALGCFALALTLVTVDAFLSVAAARHAAWEYRPPRAL